MRLLTMFLVLTTVVFLAACGGSSNEQASNAAQEAASGAVDAAKDVAETAAEHAGDVAAAAGEPVKMEVGCAMCIYHMPGVQVCTPAVKVGDQPMMLTGAELDLHAHGLCTNAGSAMVQGSVVDGKFVASHVEIQ